MARKRRLKNMVIDEVSWVDKPANLRPFLFHKSDDTVQFVKAGTKLDVAFSTKGTPESTSITVNGKTVESPIHFSMYYGANDNAPIYPDGSTAINLGCEYTVKSGEKNGFSTVQHFSLAKAGSFEITEEEATPVTEEDAAILAEIGVDAFAADGTLAKALAEPAKIVQLYKADMPSELSEALTSIIQIAMGTEPVESIEKEETPVPEQTPKVEPIPAASQTQPDAMATLAASIAQIATSMSSLVSTQKDMADRIKATEDAIKERAAIEPKPKTEPVVPNPVEDGDEEIEVDESAMAAAAMAEALAEASSATIS